MSGHCTDQKERKVKTGQSKKEGTGQNKKQKSSWFINGFLSLFLLAGVAVFIFTAVMPAIGWFAAQSWQPVPAVIDSLQLNTHSGSDSTTYSVSGHFHYQWAGRRYDSNNISLYSGNDNIGDYWQELEYRLNSARARNQVTAWVNPDDPQQAVLDRTYRVSQLFFGLIFLGMFGGFGGLMLWLTRRSADRSDGQQSMLNGEAPAAGISSENKSGLMVMMGLGGVFVAFGVPVSILALSEELPKGNLVVLAVLLFPLLGGILAYQGYRQLQRWRLIGPTPFFPDPMPGNAGGQVGGWFQLGNGRFTSLPRAELSCVHVYQTGSGKERSTHQDVIWHDHQRVSRGQRNQWHVQFDVPSELPGSGDQEGYRGEIVWQLACTGIMHLQPEQQVEFSRNWTLPVVAGASRGAWQIPESERELQQRERRADAEQSATAQIEQQRAGEELQLNSAGGRHVGSGLGLTAFGAVFTGAGVFLLNAALDEGGMLWVMFPLFFGIGLLILCFGLFWLGRSLQAVAEPGRVSMVRSLFGIRLYRRTAAITASAQLRIKDSMTVTSGNGQRTEYFRLVAEAEGKTIVLAEGIVGRDAAEALLSKVAAVVTRSLDDELGAG